MVTKSDLAMLQRLLKGVQCAPFMEPREIRLLQKLTHRGLARDFSAHAGQAPTPVKLRIWGITDAGRTALAQAVLTSPRRLALFNVYPRDGEC